MAYDDRVNVQFVHPTLSTETFTAQVSPECTPQFLLRKLIDEGWLPQAVQSTAYKLRVADTGVQIPDHAQLRSVDLGSGTLLVDHTVTGAMEVGR